MRRPSWALLFACTVWVSCATLPSPTPQQNSIAHTATRPLVPVPSATTSLSGAWLLALDPSDVGEKEGWSKTDFDDSGWTAVTVPHTWNVMPDHYDDDGVGWYRRHWTVPAEAGSAQWRVRFQAVFYAARVWVNGIFLGEHAGGYTPFEFDMTNISRPGDNVIAVRVDNRRTRERIPANLDSGWSFDWYNYGGIVRDVSVLETSRAFVLGQQIVAVPHITGADEADWATIHITATVSNRSTDTLDAVLQAEVVDDGVIARAPVRLTPGQDTQVALSLTLSSPRLWHFDHPNLYRVETTLFTTDSQVLHTLPATFGIRSVELKQAGLVLNGEPVRLVGLSRHADSPAHGLAETTAVMAADYDDLKTLNEVLSRPVHYPQSEFILDYCDRHGILLIPEVPAWQLTATQMNQPALRDLEKQQLREMVLEDFNHPSVWAWSIANEIPSDTSAGHAFVRDMIAYVKTLDPTRPVGFASNRLTQSPERDATALADFVMMNQYFGTWAGPKSGLAAALDRIHATWPDKTVIISEFGFEPTWAQRMGGAQLFNPEYYAVSTAETADAVRRRVIREQMAVYRTKSFIAGAIFWTYQDYRTPTYFQMGVVDTQRNKSGAWQALREEYAPVLIESVQQNGEGLDVRFRTRGPVEREMPAYTLRGYTLNWNSDPQCGIPGESQIALPVLEPGATWSTTIQWNPLDADCPLTVRVLRPTGFAVLEQTYDAQGQVK